MPSPNRVIVIGAGIVGLAVARELLSRFPNLRVLVLEKERGVAIHQSGHNSGVIHSGIYYPPHSEKAGMCRSGIQLLEEFAASHGIERKRVGKLIVATSESERSRLLKLHENGTANRIPGLRMISAEELKELEPLVDGLAALYLPEVALIDFRRVSEALESDVARAGGELHCFQKAIRIETGIREINIVTEKSSFQGDYLVNAAGLYCDRIASGFGCNVPARIIPFRGDYYRLAPALAGQIHRCVYPVPDPQFPFLGVHLTPTRNGGVAVGPNAVLAFAREGYRPSDINLRDVFDLLSYGGFWNLSVKYWRIGMNEMLQSAFKSLYIRSVRKFLPQIKPADLTADMTGVRAQAVKPDGTLVRDFLYLETPRAFHILNAPSPAATASLAIARRVVDKLPLIA